MPGNNRSYRRRSRSSSISPSPDGRDDRKRDRERRRSKSPSRPASPERRDDRKRDRERRRSTSPSRRDDRNRDRKRRHSRSLSRSPRPSRREDLDRKRRQSRSASPRDNGRRKRRSEERRNRSKSNERDHKRRRLRSRSRESKRSQRKLSSPTSSPERSERKRSLSHDDKDASKRKKHSESKENQVIHPDVKVKISPSESKEQDSTTTPGEGNCPTTVKEEAPPSLSPSSDMSEWMKRVEEDMKRRKERVEMERQAKKKNIELQLPLIQVLRPTKKWSLDDIHDNDDDDDVAGDDKKKGQVSSEPDDDFDQYMKVIDSEVEKTKANVVIKSENGVTSEKHQVMRITGLVKKEVKKGELMQNNADALEYSSEEEQEDLNDAMSSYKKKKTELIAPDHAKIFYRPFKKNFYIEVPELAKMSQEEVDAYRVELEEIKVQGSNCPKPVKTWAQCGVGAKVLGCMKRKGFLTPTPIQAQAIPAIMSGLDLIGIAKTGSGKTLAFLLPMFRHIADQEDLEEGDGPIGIIMTPTRELAIQIASDCKIFTKALNMNVICVYGGACVSEQIAELRRGAEIVVCTPGRMIEVLTLNRGRVTNLRRCTFVVLDEADRMFDMGFEPQVMSIIDNVRPDRQTIMFSATFPRRIESVARRILQKPIEVVVGGRSVVCKDVTQFVILLEDDEKKFLKLLELLGFYSESGSVLVFVKTQEKADDLMTNLMKRSYPCMSLHGGIDQHDRASTMGDFKAGNVKILIATSVCSRGLDVKDLILVVNYDVPDHYEDYVHRCGRTGRAGNRGFAYTFICPDQAKYAGELVKALKFSETAVPDDLNALWEKYKEEAKAEGRKVTVHSGYQGKGFKFDETESELPEQRKRLQKVALGLVVEDEDDENMDEKIEKMLASRLTVSDVEKPVTNQSAGPCSVDSQQKLEMAKLAASKISFSLNMGSRLNKGSTGPAQTTSKSIAEKMAANINARLGYSAPDETPEETEAEAPIVVETFKKYEEILDINDFPQSVRYKITSKQVLDQIIDYSEAGISVRGSYIQPNKQPKEGERRLHLSIEATNELTISKAKAEITRLIKDELTKLQNSSYQAISKGRYKVL